MKRTKLFIIAIVLFICSWAVNPEDRNLGAMIPSDQLYSSFSKVTPRFGVPGGPQVKSVDLSVYLPSPGNQGNQNSCVGWATAYALKTMQEKQERNWDLSSRNRIFSPAFVYNQINGGQDEGSFIHEALQLIVDKGCATFDTMSYRTNDYRSQPNNAAFKEASRYKGLKWYTLTEGNGWSDDTFFLFKSVLADGNGVVIAMKVYDNFSDFSGGIYSRVSGSMTGYHAMCVVGYDDRKNAVKIINSWGTGWGDGGYVWMDYEVFKEITPYAYVMEDNVTNNPSSLPAAPQNVEASKGSSDSFIKITWDAVENVDSYIVFRYGDKLVEIGRTDRTSYKDTKAKAGVEYYYYVKSANRGGESEYSNSAVGYMSKETDTTPGKPQNLTAESRNSQVYLAWEAVEGAAYYYVFRYNNSKNEYENIKKVNGTSYSDGQIGTGQTYWYVVQAINSARKGGEYSDAVSIIPQKEESGTLQLPGNFSVSAGTYRDKIAVTWNAVSGASYYILYRWNEGSQEWEELAYPEQNYYNDTNITAGSVYYYSVCAANNYTYSECTEYQSGYTGSGGTEKDQDTKSDRVPSVPQRVAASQGKYSDRVIIKWRQVKSADGYYVVKNYTPTGQSNYLEEFIWVGPLSKDTQFIDYDVHPGYTYLYYIVAYNDYGYSEYSDYAEGFLKKGSQRKKGNDKGKGSL